MLLCRDIDKAVVAADGDRTGSGESGEQHGIAVDVRDQVTVGQQLAVCHVAGIDDAEVIERFADDVQQLAVVAGGHATRRRPGVE